MLKYYTYVKIYHFSIWWCKYYYYLKLPQVYWKVDSHIYGILSKSISGLFYFPDELFRFWEVLKSLLKLQFKVHGVMLIWWAYHFKFFLENNAQIKQIKQLMLKFITLDYHNF